MQKDEGNSDKNEYVMILNGKIFDNRVLNCRIYSSVARDKQSVKRNQNSNRKLEKVDRKIKVGAI